ncbi:hypothetical protein ASPZODRAFT_153754 [Penicilliopsis zonata CBS 506.65]|uniref:BTB domain-containing protein n=1 Tax=Penicilliopsis zonata CBS 506.65 TaxID=1073090 RepID=A0A1L9SAV7_9EURO|nr:hypothetical protein ASPZODRAFT_153754 [Penicilliopsis zonata CBS 506.65]OJJ44281.1 hypothetical protein ASPZODRAFT_153754 [Penicilliopsis zonata CBS 506.65]
MVSQAPATGRSVPVPTAPSVTTRHSHSGRRHRSGRSLHGGASHQVQNDFPIFSHTGDVEILIRVHGQERRYLLHRLILTQCSGFFEASTSEEWSRPPLPVGRELRTGPSHSKPDVSSSRLSEDGSMSAGSTLVPSEINNGPAPVAGGKRWRYELDWESKAADEEPILVQKPVSPTAVLGAEFAHVPPSMTKPSALQAGFFRSMATRAGMQSVLHLSQSATIEEVNVDPLIRDYDNLFRLFYNYPPVLNSVNIATAYAECKSLLALADMYDALPVTGPRVDHHLLGFGSRLFKQIAKYPPSYLKLGYLARSRVIFSEALIHVVGQWPAALPHLRSNGTYSPIPNSVLDLIEDKVDDLEDLKARVESKLFRLTLTTSRGERVNPANAYLDWLAVSLFRQWLVDSTTPPPPSILKSTQPPPPLETASAVSASSAANAASTPTGNAPGHHRSQESTSRLLRPPAPPPNSSARVFRLLGSSSTQAYLSHEELKKFLKTHPTPSSDSLYSRDVLKRFERKMDEIKRLAREIVKPLMRNFLELDLKGPGGAEPGAEGASLPYLTCTRVEDEDLPW